MQPRTHGFICALTRVIYTPAFTASDNYFDSCELCASVMREAAYDVLSLEKEEDLGSLHDEARVIFWGVRVKSASTRWRQCHTLYRWERDRAYSGIVEIFGLVPAHSPRLSCTFTVISNSGCVSRSRRLDITKSPLSRLTVTGELSASGWISSKLADWNLTGCRFIMTEPILASSETVISTGSGTERDFLESPLSIWGRAGHWRGLISTSIVWLVRVGQPWSRANTLNLMGCARPRIESTRRMSPVLGTT